jgi:L-arabinokinase
MDCTRGSASGRLDLLGGVADYSGALVLEMPTRQSIEVTAEADEAFVVGPAVISVAEMARLADLEYADVRRALQGQPRWTHYVLGVAVVLVRHGVITPPRARLRISSDLPESEGVASSAALEVATARALGAGVIDPFRLAALCQEAENYVVGAPCGVMDQVAVAVGPAGALLPILCRPASAWPAVTLPPDLEIVGWPSGAAHDVSGAPYERARAAAFMGKRMVEQSQGRSWSWVSELPPSEVARLPELVDGAEFVRRWGGTGDPVTEVRPDEVYPVRAASVFGVEEHARSLQALAALRGGDPSHLGPLLRASQAGYDAMGLGHPAATATVEAALATRGVYGARSSGGGCGGTVAVVCERGALDHVDGAVR